MNKQDTRLNEPPPFDMDPALLDSLDGPKSVGALVPMNRNETTISVQGELVTAQKVAVERDLGKIMARIKILAAGAGMRWFYRIPFKNNKKGTTDYVEGLTIKGANAVVREYGNCLVTQRVQDMGTHWVIYARFVDLERGTTYDRPFMQRKGQDTGMGDAERRADLVFQIGVSKATRNVLVNALEDLCSYAFEEARSGLQQRINKNPEGAKKWIIDKLAELKIDVKRVAAIYGRTPDHWLVPDMAKIYAEINAIEEGMADATDVYPMIDDKESAKKPEPTPAATTQPAQPEPATAGATEGTTTGPSGPSIAPAAGGQPTYAWLLDALQKATSREAFDYVRSSWKHLPQEQQAELTQEAAALYAERFMEKKVDHEPAKAAVGAKKAAPPLFE